VVARKVKLRSGARAVTTDVHHWGEFGCYDYSLNYFEYYLQSQEYLDVPHLQRRLKPTYKNTPGMQSSHGRGCSASTANTVFAILRYRNETLHLVSFQNFYFSVKDINLPFSKAVSAVGMTGTGCIQRVYK